MSVRTNTMLVIIMCKAPVTGRVKTRLMPAYSAGDAALIHAAMAETVIERTSRMFPDSCIAADDVKHPFFEQFDMPLVEQGGGDLGERMSRLMRDAFHSGAAAVLFLGTDSPHMPEARLLEAAKLLADHDAVIGPVEDGGYDLIAMRRPCPELFEDIDWGSETVLQQTLQRAEATSVKVSLLDKSYDLDTAESIERAASIWRPSLNQDQGTAREN